MNNGRICVSVCGSTADDAFETIRRAAELADVVEVRFDCLEPEEVGPLTSRLAKRFGSPRPDLLATYRPKEQGGKRELDREVRARFWERGLDRIFWAADFEEDIIGDVRTRGWKTRICSFHDHVGVPEDLAAVYERLKAAGPGIIKIAVYAHDVTDALPVWKLLDRAAGDNVRLVPIAMGEPGKWTRILGPAHGAPLTYASAGAGNETAPGQISARDLAGVYRVRELDVSTDVYGIIAGDSSYSVSPYLHNAAFRARKLNAVFVPLQTADLDAFVRRMVKRETREIDLNFKGFSVTNPHKQAIIPHLDHLDDAARRIGAVNTVKIDDDKLVGYNTDAAGFIEPLKSRFADLAGARVAVAGAGGAARACIYSLRAEQADVTVFSRDERRASELATEFQAAARRLSLNGGGSATDFSGFDIVVNTTPLGTKGSEMDASVALAGELKGVKLVYDLTYNPSETRLIREARSAGAETIGGLEMLIGQGARQFGIWTGMDAPLEEMAAGVRARLRT